LSAGGADDAGRLPQVQLSFSISLLPPSSSLSLLPPILFSLPIDWLAGTRDTHNKHDEDRVGCKNLEVI